MGADGKTARRDGKPLWKRVGSVFSNSLLTIVARAISFPFRVRACGGSLNWFPAFFVPAAVALAETEPEGNNYEPRIYRSSRLHGKGTRHQARTPVRGGTFGPARCGEEELRTGQGVDRRTRSQDR